MLSSRSLPFLRLIVFVLAITLAFSSVVAVSAQEDQDQDEDRQTQQNQQQQRDDELQQLEEEQQFLEEERQQIEEELQQLEEENAPQRQIRQREQELRQIERAQRQIERQIQRIERQQEDQQDQQRQQGDELQQLEEERQQLEEEIQQLEEENAPQRQIRQRRQELRQVEREIRQLEQQQDRQVRQRQAEQVTLRELIRNPEDFEGARVQVTGELEETLLPHTFALESGARQVIVLAAPREVPADTQEVTVVGTVHVLTLGNLLRSLGIDVTGADMEFFLGEANDLILIAAERVTTGQEADQTDTGQVGRPDQVEDITVRELTRNPENFADQDVLVRGDVGEELGRSAFTIVERGREILVIGDRLTIPDDLGGTVEVLGQARESFDVRDIEDELGVNLSDRQLAGFEGEPFIIAETVSSSELDRPVPGAGG